jgi:hypothetical protein
MAETRPPKASEAVFVGIVTDAVGEILAVYRTPNGSAIILGSRCTAIGFDPGPLAEFRELLDRCAMPGGRPPQGECGPCTREKDCGCLTDAAAEMAAEAAGAED